MDRLGIVKSLARCSLWLAAWAACAAAAWMVCAATAWAAWRAYRHDARGSGVSAEEIKLPLAQAWVHRAAHAPAPAWPELPARQDVFRRVPTLGPTTTYDRAFQVAIADGAVYYGSSAEDTVYCLDASDGRVRWTFTTDGPVRLAPVVAGGRAEHDRESHVAVRRAVVQAGHRDLLWRTAPS